MGEGRVVLRVEMDGNERQKGAVSVVGWRLGVVVFVLSEGRVEWGAIGGG
jgi:hypothetical protein